MKRTLLLHVDGLNGFPAEGPYDRILVSAQPPDGFDPRLLTQQLRKQSGILLFPNNELIQQRYDRSILLETRYGPQVNFVPLKEGKEWK